MLGGGLQACLEDVHQRKALPLLPRWEAPRWHFIGALEAREGLGLGCNMPGHICTPTSSKCCNVFWRCSTSGGTGQEGQVHPLGCKPPLCPGGCGDIVPRGPPIVPGPRTPPLQGGNWGTKGSEGIWRLSWDLSGDPWTWGWRGFDRVRTYIDMLLILFSCLFLL